MVGYAYNTTQVGLCIRNSVIGYVFLIYLGFFLIFNLPSLFISSPFIRKSRQHLEAAQVCDILKFVLIVVCCWLLQYVDISMLYHIVRGQAVIKLYIIYNMLEVNIALLLISFEANLEILWVRIC